MSCSFARSPSASLRCSRTIPTPPIINTRSAAAVSHTHECCQKGLDCRVRASTLSAKNGGASLRRNASRRSRSSWFILTLHPIPRRLFANNGGRAPQMTPHGSYRHLQRPADLLGVHVFSKPENHYSTRFLRKRSDQPPEALLQQGVCLGRIYTDLWHFLDLH